MLLLIFKLSMVKSLRNFRSFVSIYYKQAPKIIDKKFSPDFQDAACKHLVDAASRMLPHPFETLTLHLLTCLFYECFQGQPGKLFIQCGTSLDSLTLILYEYIVCDS